MCVCKLQGEHEVENVVATMKDSLWRCMLGVIPMASVAIFSC